MIKNIKKKYKDFRDTYRDPTVSLKYKIALTYCLSVLAILMIVLPVCLVFIIVKMPMFFVIEAVVLSAFYSFHYVTTGDGK